jgi:hypothetical protein
LATRFPGLARIAISPIVVTLITKKEARMSSNTSVGDFLRLHDRQELPTRLAQYDLTTSAGTAALRDGSWHVILTTDGDRIRRDVWLGTDPWQAETEGWEPEGIIWPTWPVRPGDEITSSKSALNSVQKYWNKSGNRLRDSAKWMATVLGAALATLAGTSPLSPIRQHHTLTAVLLFLAGLLLLGITLFLVLQVMRPQAISFSDVQRARKHRGPFGSALGRWHEIVESQEDLYLPCGVKCLTSLRQSMIIEKMTLMALALAKERPPGCQMRQQLEEAQEARALRLTELRQAASQIALIGEYYKLRGRSTRATYGGILCTLIGIAALLAAFTWPVT